MVCLTFVVFKQRVVRSHPIVPKMVMTFQEPMSRSSHNCLSKKHQQSSGETMEHASGEWDFTGATTLYCLPQEYIFFSLSQAVCIVKHFCQNNWDKLKMAS